MKPHPYAVSEFIKMNIHQTRNSDQWKALADKVVNIWAAQTKDISWLTEQLIAS
jgi:hypothetical protein